MLEIGVKIFGEHWVIHHGRTVNLRSGESFGVTRNQVGGVDKSKMKEILIHHVFKHRSCVLER